MVVKWKEEFVPRYDFTRYYLIVNDNICGSFLYGETTEDFYLSKDKFIPMNCNSITEAKKICLSDYIENNRDNKIFTLVNI